MLRSVDCSYRRFGATCRSIFSCLTHEYSTEFVPNVGNYNLRSVTSQNGTDIISTAEEAWNHSSPGIKSSSFWQNFLPFTPDVKNWYGFRDDRFEKTEDKEQRTKRYSG